MSDASTSVIQVGLVLARIFIVYQFNACESATQSLCPLPVTACTSVTLSLVSRAGDTRFGRFPVTAPFMLTPNGRLSHPLSV